MLKEIIEGFSSLAPDHQFGFSNKHATVEDVHRITDITEKCMEKKIVSAILLNVAHAFDNVWHSMAS